MTPSTAFRIGEKTNDPLAMYREDLYTVTANLAGIAGISFPCGQSKSGLPIGVQLQSPPFQEELLLRAAHQFVHQLLQRCRRIVATPDVGRRGLDHGAARRR